MQSPARAVPTVVATKNLRGPYANPTPSFGGEFLILAVVDHVDGQHEGLGAGAPGDGADAGGLVEEQVLGRLAVAGDLHDEGAAGFRGRGGGHLMTLADARDEIVVAGFQSHDRTYAHVVTGIQTGAGGEIRQVCGNSLTTFGLFPPLAENSAGERRELSPERCEMP